MSNKCSRCKKINILNSKYCQNCKDYINSYWNKSEAKKKHNLKTNKTRKFRSQELEAVTYIIINKAWKNWYKIGYTCNFYNVMSGYNRCCPFKDYKEVFRFEGSIIEMKELEKQYHKYNKNPENGEWYNKPLKEIIKQLELLLIEIKTGCVD